MINPTQGRFTQLCSALYRRPSRHGNVPPSPLEIRTEDLNRGHIAAEGQAPANAKESNPLHTESVA